MPATRTTSTRRARRSFWILLLASVLAAGSLSNALAAEPGQTTGMRVAISGFVLVVAMTLAARAMIALERAHRQARTTSEPPNTMATATRDRRK